MLAGLQVAKPLLSWNLMLQCPAPSASRMNGSFPSDDVGTHHWRVVALTTMRNAAFHLEPVRRLRVFAVKATGPSGQGLALNLALRHAQAPLIGDHAAICCLFFLYSN